MTTRKGRENGQRARLPRAVPRLYLKAMAHAAERRQMTEGEYLAFEREAQVKHEYVAGEVFAMAGASLRHNGIVANLMGLLSQALRGGPCRVFPSDHKVHIASRDVFTYPDVSVVCGEVAVYPGTSDVITNPKVLFEVLSDSTERYDRGDKAEAYRTIPSLSAHVLLVQQRPHIECYARQGATAAGFFASPVLAARSPFPRCPARSRSTRSTGVSSTCRADLPGIPSRFTPIDWWKPRADSSALRG